VGGTVGASVGRSEGKDVGDSDGLVVGKKSPTWFAHTINSDCPVM
jgi:hypothetical protein